MQLRDLTLDQLRWLHATELHEAFPAEELKPFPAMEQLFRRGAYRPVGAWEGETLVGYALLWTSPAAGYVLIDYLGVTAARRNGGLGGEILRLLQEKFRAWEGILVESEAPEGGPEDALRRRRLGFYQRNGFRPLSYDCLLFGVQAFKEKLYRDPLTGIYNRRYYEEVVRKSIGPAGIALIDVDDFKICNDTYGHYAGDMALKTVANTIQSCIRASDLLIRYGGDEFLLVLSGIPGDFLQTKLEQIRTAAQMASVPGYSHFRISLSIGGTIQSLADPMENIVRRADWLMYQAKCRKNAVMVEVPGHDLAALEKLLQNKPQILLVDDSAMNRMMLTEILGDSYHILEAENGRECMEKLQAEAGNIALVLLDINMPVMDGFEVLKAMNANHTIEDIPVIMISSEDSDATIRRSYELGASDYVNRPFDARIVYRRVTNTIKLYAKQRRLVQMVSEQIRARENNTDMLVGVLSHIVEFRNGESGAHVRHIRIITELLLHRLLEISSKYSITAEQQDMIPLASALHDIGKIGIDEKILNKPGRLTPEEFEVMKTHSMLGAKMLHDLDNFAEQPLLQTAYEIARWHHERWDGRGYPDGLKGDEIPISAQLVSLADVYDALTSERCYKKAFSHEKAVQMILNSECGAFNPLLLQCLTDIQADLKEELQQRN